VRAKFLQRWRGSGSNVRLSVCQTRSSLAQLSQRDRATFRVIKYFAKSLKITQDHSKWHCWVGRV